MLKVALIGAGTHSRTNHAPALRCFRAEHPDAVELAGVCDLDAAKAEQFREEFGFGRAFADIDAMLDAVEVDAIVAIMPIPAILPVARQIFARGLPVLMEKPPGQDMGEARAVVAAAEETGCPVMVSMNRRHDPALVRARDWMRGLCPLRAIHGVQLRHRRTEASFIWGTAIHVLDLMVHLAGPLRLRTGGVASAPFEAGVSRMALLDGEAGVTGSVHILPCCGRVEERVRVCGEDWCVDIWPGSVQPWRVEGWRDRELDLAEESPEDEPEFRRSGALNETEAFLSALLRGEPLPGPAPADVLPSAELAAALDRQS
jgi:predicted dehydrogenase